MTPRCPVAEDAVSVRMIVIKNVIQTWPDSALERWVSTESGKNEFVNRLAGVRDRLEDFSAAAVVDIIGPLARLPENRKSEIKEPLKQAFERQFDVERRRERLGRSIEALRAAFATVSEGTNESRGQNLDLLRSSATALRVELESLPRGFWVRNLRSYAERRLSEATILVIDDQYGGDENHREAFVEKSGHPSSSFEFCRGQSADGRNNPAVASTRSTGFGTLLAIGACH